MLFFRESCFKPSGDKPRGANPTHYRCEPLPLIAFFCSALSSMHNNDRPLHDQWPQGAAYGLLSRTSHGCSMC
jgi:hypothetical protein